MDVCVDACNELGGGIAAWLFAVGAWAWGYWNKRRLAVQRRETARYKELSLRPPAARESRPHVIIAPPFPSDPPPENEGDA